MPLGFEIFKMVTVAMVALKLNWFVDPIAMKLHSNDPWDSPMYKKCLLNYEFQNIEYQVGNGFSPAVGFF